MSNQNSLKRFIREPLVQFLFIGSCIYGLFFLFGQGEEEPGDNVLRVDMAMIDGLIGQWENRWGRAPTRDEIHGLIDNYVREEVLYRQAVAMGLNKDDPITRRRMAQKLEFLSSDLASAQEPAEGELEQFFADNEADYRSGVHVTFLQVFFNPDSRKNATIDDAEAELRKLEEMGTPDPATLQAGDRSLVGSHFTNVDETTIARQLGGGFAESVMRLEPGQWHGPVLSGFGVHLVYIFELEPGHTPEFETVKDQVREDWLEARRQEFNAEFLENLKSRHNIVIDEIPEDRVLPVSRAPTESDGNRKPGAAS